MTDIRNKNVLIQQGRLLVENSANVEMSIGEWIDLYVEVKGELKGIQKTLAADMLAKLYERINADLAA